jgi:hypothetical protein
LPSSPQKRMLDIFQSIGWPKGDYVSIVVSHNKPDLLLEAVIELQSAGLLQTKDAPNKFIAVAHHLAPYYLASAFATLHKAGALTDQARELVESQSYPIVMAQAIATLHSNEFLSDDLAYQYWIKLISDRNPMNLTSMANAIALIKKSELILSESLFHRILSHQSPEACAGAYIAIHQQGLMEYRFSESLVNTLLTRPYPDFFARALIILQRKQFLSNEMNNEHLLAVFNHNDPEAMAKALVILHVEKVFSSTMSEPYFRLVRAHCSPIGMANALVTLQKNGRFEDKYIEAISSYKYPDILADILIIYHLINGEVPAETIHKIIISDSFSIRSALNNLLHGGLLSGDAAKDNFDMVLQSRNPTEIAKALIAYKKHKLELFIKKQELFNHPHPNKLANAVVALQESELLSPVCISKLLTHKDPEIVANVLTLLHKLGLLTEVIQAAALEHSQIESLYNSLVIFQGLTLLVGEFAKDRLNTLISHPSPDYLASGVKKLYESNKLSPENALTHLKEMLTHRNPLDLAHALVTCQHGKLLEGSSAQRNLRAVIDAQFPDEIAINLALLQHEGLLSGSFEILIRDAITTHQYPSALAKLIVILTKSGLLTSENLDALKQHPTPFVILEVLTILQNAGLLTVTSRLHSFDNFNLLITRKNLEELKAPLAVLQQSKLLSSRFGLAILNAVIGHPCPLILANTIVMIFDNKLFSDESAVDDLYTVFRHEMPFDVLNVLTKLEMCGLFHDGFTTNFLMIIRHQAFDKIALAIQILHKNRMLIGESAQKNLHALVMHPHLAELTDVITYLQKSGILTQLCLDRLIEYSSILFGTDETIRHWSSVSECRLTDEHMQSMFQICADSSSDQALKQQRIFSYINTNICCKQMPSNTGFGFFRANAHVNGATLAPNPLS